MAKERIYPTGFGTGGDNGNFALTGAATKYEAIDDPFNARNVADYIACQIDGQFIRFTLGNTSANIGTGTVINSITPVHVAGANGTTYGGQRTSAAFRSNSLDTYGAYASSPGLIEQRDTFGQDNDSTPWTKTKLDALELVLRFNSPEGAQYVQAYIEIDYVADPTKVGAARGVGSRRLRLLRRPVPLISGRVPLRFLDVGLLTDCAWSALSGPTTGDEGWGSKTWQRRLGRRLSISFDLDNLDLSVQDLDVRHLLTHLWDPMISEEPPGTTRPGIPGLTPGAGRLFARASKAWVENAAAAAQGLKQVVEIPDDVEKNTTEGELIEGAATNDLLRSSFVNGLTGLTAIGTAGQTTLDTADLLFDPGITPNSLKITRNATAEDQGRAWPATAAYAANDDVVVSIDYKNDSSVAVSWYLQRSSDSNYWRDSDGTWQGSIQYNAPPVSTSPARFISKAIDVGSGTPTLTLSIVHRTADANGTISHIYHAQIEKNFGASSRIVTTTATVTRVLDNLRIENNSGKRVVPVDQGHIRLAFKANWNRADAVNSDLLMAFYDASNFTRLFYSPSTTQLRYRRRIAGTNYTADFSLDVVRETLYYVTVRCTGAEGELGLTAYTMDIFVNGVKGTSAVSVAFGSLPSDPLYLYIGQDETNIQHLNGFLRLLDASPYVPTDEEIAGDQG